MKQGCQKQSKRMWVRLNWHRIGISNELLCVQQLNFWYHERKAKVKSLSTVLAKELRYPLNRKAGGSQSHSGGLGKGNNHFHSQDSNTEPSIS